MNRWCIWRAEQFREAGDTVSATQWQKRADSEPGPDPEFRWPNGFNRGSAIAHVQKHAQPGMPDDASDFWVLGALNTLLGSPRTDARPLGSGGHPLGGGGPGYNPNRAGDGTFAPGPHKERPHAEHAQHAHEASAKAEHEGTASAHQYAAYSHLQAGRAASAEGNKAAAKMHDSMQDYHKEAAANVAGAGHGSPEPAKSAPTVHEHAMAASDKAIAASTKADQHGSAANHNAAYEAHREASTAAARAGNHDLAAKHGVAMNRHGDALQYANAASTAQQHHQSANSAHTHAQATEAFATAVRAAQRAGVKSTVREHQEMALQHANQASTAANKSGFHGDHYFAAQAHGSAAQIASAIGNHGAAQHHSRLQAEHSAADLAGRAPYGVSSGPGRVVANKASASKTALTHLSDQAANASQAAHASEGDRHGVKGSHAAHEAAFEAHREAAEAYGNAGDKAGEAKHRELASQHDNIASYIGLHDKAVAASAEAAKTGTRDAHLDAMSAHRAVIQKSRGMTKHEYVRGGTMDPTYKAAHEAHSAAMEHHGDIGHSMPHPLGYSNTRVAQA